VQNVIFVHNHNHNNNAQSVAAAVAYPTTFRVGLNRFSDLRLSQILPVVLEEEEDIDDEQDADEKKHHRNHRKHHNRWTEAAAILEEAQTMNKGNNNNNIININGINLDSSSLTLFSSHEQILDVAAKFMAMGKRGLHLTTTNNHNNNEQKPKMTIKDLYIPTFDGGRHPLEPFQAGPDVSKNHKSGFLVSIKSNNNDNNNKQGNDHKNNNNNNNGGGDDDDGDYDISDGPGTGTIGGDGGGGEDFTTYLNWATMDNPDGVPLVHEPID
jgi:hypothetical protein